MTAPLPRPVVVVDDDADDLFFAQRALQKAGVGGAIKTCANGREVVAWLEDIAAQNQPLPRVVFLDVKMPGLNGFDTLKWIRERTAFAAMPVIMLSGSKEPRDVEMARTLGANGYLVKYPEPAEFARVLAEAERPK